MWETARGKVQAYDRPALTRMTKLLTLSLLALLLLACGSEVKEPSDIQEVGSDGIVSGETYWVHLEGLPVVFITFPKGDYEYEYGFSIVSAEYADSPSFPEYIYVVSLGPNKLIIRPDTGEEDSRTVPRPDLDHVFDAIVEGIYLENPRGVRFEPTPEPTPEGAIYTSAYVDGLEGGKRYWTELSHYPRISFTLPKGRTYSIFAEEFIAEDGGGYIMVIALTTGSLETHVIIDLETGEEIDRAVGGRYGKTDNPGHTDFLLDEIMASIEIH